MQSFEVIGGNKLQGSITPQGAKNEALQILCAVLLSPEEIEITNVPDILDVRLLIEILQDLGVKVVRLDRGSFSFKSDQIDLTRLDNPEFHAKAGRIRGSVMLAGPLLARFKQAIIPRPGGDKIGRRKMDTHVLGFEKLGVQHNYKPESGCIHLSVNQLKGTEILLDEPSVTGTANLIMAAVLAKGTTTLYNAACEPYIQQLCQMLNRMGARISGIRSNLLTIEGVEQLQGCSHRLLPDMIEVGSFIGMAALTGSNIRICNAGIEQLGIIPDKFRQLGISLKIDGDDILVDGELPYSIQDNMDGSILTISDHPWPGLTPDLLSIILVTAIQAKGSVLIHQKMFESRLFFVDKLIDMGARIILCDPHRANVIGLERSQALRGITMSSPDIRAGVSLLIAALSAEGKSLIQNVSQIDRGYEQLDIRLQKLGAQIKRVEA
ncbi:MAG: UDP-N-acetylglucosamine 1-carboxyvinyltransferase [Bacteroidetes bacterium]|nr:UDP-N-acetylglucosamine 1-carboxyvinyltransferase [Bacteroidota bacterium]